jgi:hypothetical protein
MHAWEARQSVIFVYAEDSHIIGGKETVLMLSDSCCAYLVSAASAAAWLLLEMVR